MLCGQFVTLIVLFFRFPKVVVIYASAFGALNESFCAVTCGDVAPVPYRPRPALSQQGSSLRTLTGIPETTGRQIRLLSYRFSYMPIFLSTPLTEFIIQILHNVEWTGRKKIVLSIRGVIICQREWVIIGDLIGKEEVSPVNGSWFEFMF